MKVYTCWSGSYSDRGMGQIFSTKEKAEKYLAIMKNITSFEDWDDNPIEYEVDKVDIKEPDGVVFSVWKSEGHDWDTYSCDDEDKELEKLYMINNCWSNEKSYPQYKIKVKYNTIEVMKKAAIDKAISLYARDIGI